MQITSATREAFAPTLPLTDRRINVDLKTRQIAVRIAGWQDAHSGLPGAVRMPRNVNLDAAHVGHAQLDDGSQIDVANLPMGTMHAKQGLTAAQAAAMYENTGTSVARVRYSVDDEGIRADGILYDDVDQSTIDRLVASAPSGDWRALSMVRRPEDFEHTPSDFAGACIVNIPGYSSTFSQSPATPMRLVASADSMILFDGEPVMEDEVEAEVEAAAEETPEVEGGEACADGPACDGCTCGRAEDAEGGEAGDAGESEGVGEDGDGEDSASDVPEDIAALRASLVAGLEQVDALIASSQALTAAGAMDHGADMVTRDEFDMLVGRLADLEMFIAEAILST